MSNAPHVPPSLPLPSPLSLALQCKLLVLFCSVIQQTVDSDQQRAQIQKPPESNLPPAALLVKAFQHKHLPPAQLQPHPTYCCRHRRVTPAPYPPSGSATPLPHTELPEAKHLTGVPVRRYTQRILDTMDNLYEQADASSESSARADHAACCDRLFCSPHQLLLEG